MAVSILVRDSDDEEFITNRLNNDEEIQEKAKEALDVHDDGKIVFKSQTYKELEMQDDEEKENFQVDEGIVNNMRNNHVCDTSRGNKKLILHCLLTAQTGCFFLLTLFYASLILGRPGPHLPTLDEHNNLNSLLQMFESWAVDAVTVLFVVTGCLDYARIHDTNISTLHNMYQINILVLPVMSLVNYITIPFGMFATGTYNSFLSWIINLSTPLLLSPFFEYDQISRARLFNEPTAIIMTLLLCRCMFHIAKFTIDSSKKAIPEHHELLNLIIIIFQTIMGCIMTSVHQYDNHFYYSFRFIMTRFSEYSLGVMCFEYLYLNKIQGIFSKLSNHTIVITNVTLFIHTIIWLSQVDQIQKHDLHTIRCPRIAYLAPCMTHFDAIVSRAVPLSFCIVVACINAKSNPVPWIWENYHLAQLANVFIFPVSLLFSLFMKWIQLQKVATIIMFLSIIVNYIVTWSVNEFIVPVLIVYSDRLLDKFEMILQKYKN